MNFHSSQHTLEAWRNIFLICAVAHALSAIVFVAFTGYGRIATLGEEIHDPARSIPRAVVITVLVTVALYLLVALAALLMRTGAAAARMASSAPRSAVSCKMIEQRLRTLSQDIAHAVISLTCFRRPSPPRG